MVFLDWEKTIKATFRFHNIPEEPGYSTHHSLYRLWLIHVYTSYLGLVIPLIIRGDGNSGDVSLYLPEALGHFSTPFRPCWMSMELRPVQPEFLGLAVPELRRPPRDLHERFGKMRLKLERW